MKLQEKLVARADLIAAGLIRFHKFNILTPVEMGRALEILAEDLASIEDRQEALKIRDRVERYGLQIPGVDVVVRIPAPTNARISDVDCSPVHAETTPDTERQENIELSRDKKLCGSTPNATGPRVDPVHVHPAAVHSPQVKEKIGLKLVGGYYKGLTSVYNRGPESTAVHPTTALGAQEQENGGCSQADGVCKGLTLADTQGSESPDVYQSASSTPQAQQKDEPGQGGGLSNLLPKAPRQSARPAQVQKDEEIREHLEPRGSTGSGTWRNCDYHRVPVAIETAVYEKFKQGWSKSKLAREFRLNRRTIIRICRDRAAK